MASVAAAVSQAQLKRQPQGMHAIAIQSMNISQVIQSPRPPVTQINNLYNSSGCGNRDGIALAAGNKENTTGGVGSAACEDSQSIGINKNSNSAQKVAKRAGSVFVDGGGAALTTSEKKN